MVGGINTFAALCGLHCHHEVQSISDEAVGQDRMWLVQVQYY